jgi:Omp85 superfamily domain
VRPTGGRALVEGNVEYRFPIWRQRGGAAFLDGAFVGEGSLGSVTKGTGALTPGVGVRYYASVGPIRVDLGYNPGLPESLPVFTEVDGRIVQLRKANGEPITRTYQPQRTFLQRLTLHLSIGQAF